MAFGRETRFPFLDYDLVDWVTRLPEEALVKSGWQKYILRRAADGLLPERIQWRADKVGYAAPLDVWLRGPLREWAHEQLFRGPAGMLSEFDEEAVRNDWDQHQCGAAERSWALWRWISLNQWLSMFERNTWKRGAPTSLRPAAVRA
jgi:asparagine synthase (glutamine-hydrolysing)